MDFFQNFSKKLSDMNHEKFVPVHLVHRLSV